MDLTFWINAHKANAAGKVPVSLRITVHGKRAEVTTGIRCLPAEWDKATKRLVSVEWKPGQQQHVRLRKPTLATQQLNTVLDDLEANTRLLASDLRTAATPERPFTAAAVRLALVPPPPAPPAPIPCALVLLDQAVLTHANLFTREAAVTALNAVRRHLHPATTLPLPQLTAEWVADFVAAAPPAAGYLGALRALFTRCRLGVANPFGAGEKRGKPARAKPRHILSAPQLAALAALELPAGGREALARDLYLTQYYLHGSRVGVMLELSWSQLDLQAGRARFKAEKGGDWQNVKLNPRLVAILRPYWPGPSAAGPVFPLLPADYASRPALERHRLRKAANTRVWHGLQVVAGLLQLPGRLHSHTARHTLATHTVQRTGDYRLAQRFLGHSTLEMTENYIQDLLTDALDAGGDAVYGD